MKKIIYIFLVLLFTSCLTTKYKSTEVDLYGELEATSAYIGAFLNSSYYVTLVNLDTNEEVYLKLESNPYFSIYEIPVGSFTIKEIETAGGVGGGLTLHVPFPMKTIINGEPNSLTYIGNLETKTKRSGDTIYYYLIFNYTWEESLEYIKEFMTYQEDFTVFPLKMLSINREQED